MQPVFGSPWEMSASIVVVGLMATVVSVGMGVLVSVGAAVGTIAVVVPLLHADRVKLITNRVREIFLKSFPPRNDRSPICTDKISR